ncbi:MAG: hypothetical protein AAGI63_13145 [Planctomycetota bacterium]
MQQSNPYEAPPQPADELHAAQPLSRWHGFKRGFRHGTLWSMLIVVPMTPGFYDMDTRYQRRIRDSDLPAMQSAIAWIGAAGTALTFITLPWAFSAGCVQHARFRRRKESQNR